MAKKQTFAQLYKEKFDREYGKGEIKYFTPQIKRAIELIPNDELEDGRLAYIMKEKLADLGFTTSTSSGIAFIGNKQVIKVSFLRDGIAGLPAQFRVPTEVVKKINCGYHILIQPRVRTFAEIKTKKYGLQERFNDELSDHNPNHLDRASRNLGIYKRKLVLFDW